MAERTSNGSPIDPVVSRALREAIEAIPPEDKLEWVGMTMILEAQERWHGFDEEVIVALLEGLLARRTPAQVQEMIYEVKRGRREAKHPVAPSLTPHAPDTR